MKVEKTILDGRFVRLEPLELRHLDALWAVGRDEKIWRWSPVPVNDFDDMRKYIETALNERKQKIALPFATVEKSSDRVVGSTRFGNIDTGNRRVEIGWTWIGKDWQRTFVNTEAKFLMLRHAFEIWRCIRVEFKTDSLNEKSRNAIVRIGAKEEGVLRQHIITASGRLRDSVYYSILDGEWQHVKADLEAKLKTNG